MLVLSPAIQERSRSVAFFILTISVSTWWQLSIHSLHGSMGNGGPKEMLWERGHDYERESEQGDPAVLERIIVNYIRHNLTEYDTHLE